MQAYREAERHTNADPASPGGSKRMRFEFADCSSSQAERQVTGLLTQKLGNVSDPRSPDDLTAPPLGTALNDDSESSYDENRRVVIDTPMSNIEGVAENLYFDDKESVQNLIKQSCGGSHLKYESLLAPVLIKSPLIIPERVDMMMLDTRYTSRGRAFASYIDPTLSVGLQMPSQYPMQFVDVPESVMKISQTCLRPLETDKWYNVAYWRLCDEEEQPFRADGTTRVDLSRAFDKHDTEHAKNRKEGFERIQQKVREVLGGEVLVFFKVVAGTRSRYCYVPRPSDQLRLKIPRALMSIAVFTLEDLGSLVDEMIDIEGHRPGGTPVSVSVAESACKTTPVSISSTAVPRISSTTAIATTPN